MSIATRPMGMLFFGLLLMNYLAVVISIPLFWDEKIPVFLEGLFETSLIDWKKNNEGSTVEECFYSSVNDSRYLDRFEIYLAGLFGHPYSYVHGASKKFITWDGKSKNIMYRIPHVPSGNYRLVAELYLDDQFKIRLDIGSYQISSFYVVPNPTLPIRYLVTQVTKDTVWRIYAHKSFLQESLNRYDWFYALEEYGGSTGCFRERIEFDKNVYACNHFAPFGGIIKPLELNTSLFQPLSHNNINIPYYLDVALDIDSFDTTLPHEGRFHVVFYAVSKKRSKGYILGYASLLINGKSEISLELDIGMDGKLKTSTKHDYFKRYYESSIFDEYHYWKAAKVGEELSYAMSEYPVRIISPSLDIVSGKLHGIRRIIAAVPNVFFFGRYGGFYLKYNYLDENGELFCEAYDNKGEVLSVSTSEDGQIFIYNKIVFDENIPSNYSLHIEGLYLPPFYEYLMYIFVGDPLQIQKFEGDICDRAVKIVEARRIYTVERNERKRAKRDTQQSSISRTIQFQKKDPKKSGGLAEKERKQLSVIVIKEGFRHLLDTLFRRKRLQLQFTPPIDRIKAVFEDFDNLYRDVPTIDGIEMFDKFQTPSPIYFPHLLYQSLIYSGISCLDMMVNRPFYLGITRNTNSYYKESLLKGTKNGKEQETLDFDTISVSFRGEHFFNQQDNVFIPVSFGSKIASKTQLKELESIYLKVIIAYEDKKKNINSRCFLENYIYTLEIALFLEGKLVTKSNFAPASIIHDHPERAKIYASHYLHQEDMKFIPEDEDRTRACKSNNTLKFPFKEGDCEVPSTYNPYRMSGMHHFAPNNGTLHIILEKSTEDEYVKDLRIERNHKLDNILQDIATR